MGLFRHRFNLHSEPTPRRQRQFGQQGSGGQGGTPAPVTGKETAIAAEDGRVLVDEAGNAFVTE